MSEREAALLGLRTASEICSAAIKALTSNTTPKKSVSLQVLLSDYISLLNLLYTSTTKLSFALKPPKPTFSACSSVLKDISSQADSLASCACCFDKEHHGVTLTKEVIWSAEEVIRSLKTLLELFTDTYDKKKATGDNYLVQTGVVHESIEKAKLVPTSERDAVRKRWEANLGGMDDGMREVVQMLDDYTAEEPEDLNMDSMKITDSEDDDGDDDDDWGEFDFRGGRASRPTEEELSRIKLTNTLLRLTHALYKRILVHMLDERTAMPQSAEFLQPSSLNEALRLSTTALEVSDELVSAIDIPHQPDSLSRSLLEYKRSLDALRRFLASLGIVQVEEADPLTSQLSREEEAHGKATELQNSNRHPIHGKQFEGERKWFNACFSQIHKSYRAVEESLPRDTTEISGAIS